MIIIYNDIICINCRWRRSEERQRQGVLTTYFVFRILYFYVYLYLFSRTQIKFVFTSMYISCKHQSFWWENNTDEFYWFSQCVSTWYHLWVSYLSIISLFGGRRGGDDQVKVWTDDCVNSVWYNLVLTMIKILLLAGHFWRLLSISNDRFRSWDLNLNDLNYALSNSPKIFEIRFAQMSTARKSLSYQNR